MSLFIILEQAQFHHSHFLCSRSAFVIYVCNKVTFCRFCLSARKCLCTWLQENIYNDCNRQTWDDLRTRFHPFYFCYSKELESSWWFSYANVAAADAFDDRKKLICESANTVSFHSLKQAHIRFQHAYNKSQSQTNSGHFCCDIFEWYRSIDRLVVWPQLALFAKQLVDAHSQDRSVQLKKSELLRVRYGDSHWLWMAKPWTFASHAYAYACAMRTRVRVRLQSLKCTCFYLRSMH